MTEYKKVKSTVEPEAVRFDEYSVWVTENVNKIEVEYEGEVSFEFEFDQKRYTKNEYIKLLDEKNAELEGQLTDTQLALCEIYEGMI